MYIQGYVLSSGDKTVEEKHGFYFGKAYQLVIILAQWFFSGCLYPATEN